MAFASFDSQRAGAPMSEINMVPLIDVMLVLLVIFIVTAPLLTHAVKLELPRLSADAKAPKPDKIDLAIDAAGTLYWNGEAVSRDEAAGRLTVEGAKHPQPDLQLRVDQTVAYRHVAQALADAAKAGLTRIAFVGEPQTRTAAPP